MVAPTKGFNWGKEKIQIYSETSIISGVPSEIHFKEDGAINGPSLAVVIHGGKATTIQFDIIGEVSVEMLNDACKEFGYKLIKI